MVSSRDKSAQDLEAARDAIHERLEAFAKQCGALMEKYESNPDEEMLPLLATMLEKLEEMTDDLNPKDIFVDDKNQELKPPEAPQFSETAESLSEYVERDIISPLERFQKTVSDARIQGGVHMAFRGELETAFYHMIRDIEKTNHALNPAPVVSPPIIEVKPSAPPVSPSLSPMGTPPTTPPSSPAAKAIPTSPDVPASVSALNSQVASVASSPVVSQPASPVLSAASSPWISVPATPVSVPLSPAIPESPSLSGTEIRLGNAKDKCSQMVDKLYNKYSDKINAKYKIAGEDKIDADKAEKAHDALKQFDALSEKFKAELREMKDSATMKETFETYIKSFQGLSQSLRAAHSSQSFSFFRPQGVRSEMANDIDKLTKDLESEYEKLGGSMKFRRGN